MTDDEIDDLIRRYNARFDNMAEISMPQILYDPRWHALLEEAIRTGEMLTSEKIDQVIPDVAWEF